MALPPGVAAAPSDGKVVIRVGNISATYTVDEARAIAAAIMSAAAAAPTQRHLQIFGGLDVPQRPRYEDLPKAASVEVHTEENVT